MGAFGKTFGLVQQATNTPNSPIIPDGVFIDPETGAYLIDPETGDYIVDPES